MPTGTASNRLAALEFDFLIAIAAFVRHQAGVVGGEGFEYVDARGGVGGLVGGHFLVRWLVG